MAEYSFISITSKPELDSIIQDAQWEKSGAELDISAMQRDQQENAENRNAKQDTLDRAIGKEADLTQKLTRLSATDPEKSKVEAYLAEASGRVTRLRFDANKSVGELQIQEQRAINLLQAKIDENTSIITGATARKAELP